VNAAIIPVASMLAIQIVVSICVLSLGVMMPAVAADLGIDPKLVGVFTALTYVVAAVGALFTAGPIVRFGAVRICQAALLIGAVGLALNSLASVAATVVAVLLIGATQGPANPAAAHVLAQRTPREWFGIVFSIKQTGVPIGFALAGVIFPLLLGWVGWRGASLVAAGAIAAFAILIEPLRPRIDVIVKGGTATPSVWRSIRFVLSHPKLRVLGYSAVIYVVAQHTFTFYLVTYLYQHNGLTIPQAGALLAAAQLSGTVMRLISGWMGDRMSRMKLLGWTGIAMALGCTATGFLASDAPYWLVALTVVGYGVFVISWNGTSQAEFAHLAPPGEAAAVTAVQTALAFSGAVFGPPLFALISSVASYRAAFLTVAVCVLVAAIWQLLAARRQIVPLKV
jgi:MFS family permease